MEINIDGIETLATDFFSNRSTCRPEPVQLTLGEECYVVDQSMIDEENESYAFIPCIVVRIDQSTRIPGRWYYALQAKDSINDKALNSIKEGDLLYYKYLENTSPFLMKINEVR